MFVLQHMNNHHHPYIDSPTVLSDRNVGRGGGSMVYLTEGLKSVRRHDLESHRLEISWMEVKSRKRNILIGNVYMPPIVLKCSG